MGLPPRCSDWLRSSFALRERYHARMSCPLAMKVSKCDRFSVQLDAAGRKPRRSARRDRSRSSSECLFALHGRRWSTRRIYPRRDRRDRLEPGPHQRSTSHDVASVWHQSPQAHLPIPRCGLPVDKHHARVARHRGVDCVGLGRQCSRTPTRIQVLDWLTLAYIGRHLFDRFLSATVPVTFSLIPSVTRGQ